MNAYFSRVPMAAIRDYSDGRRYAYIPHFVVDNGIIENFDKPQMMRFDGCNSFITDGEAYVQFALRGDAIPLNTPLPFGVTVVNKPDTDTAGKFSDYLKAASSKELINEIEANNMILVSKTYSETTPESVEDGETSDSGFIFENAECTFRELVAYMREHPNASQHHAKGNTAEWYGSGYSVDDYTAGTETETCIHYGSDNPKRKAKYWRKAAVAAGIVKGQSK